MNKINVLMFDAAYPPPIVGGKEKQAHLLAKELVRQGVTVSVISYIHSGNKSEVYEGVRINRVPKGLLAIPLLLLNLIRRRFYFNILHIHTPSGIGVVVSIFGFLLGYKVAFKFPNEHLLDNLNWIGRFSWNIVFLTTKLLIVLEEDTRQKLLDRKVNDHKIFLASNGVEMIALPLNIDRPKSKSEINIIFVGRLVPQKGIFDLIKACALLNVSEINWKLSIIGSGPFLHKLKSLSGELNLLDRITFLGFQTEVSAIMQNADILVLPSEKEGMSNVLLEAIAVGLPIIATDVGAARKQVGPFGEQFLCKPSDPVCLAEKIGSLSQDVELRKEYSVYLYNRGIDMFAIGAIARQYIEKYMELT